MTDGRGRIFPRDENLRSAVPDFGFESQDVNVVQLPLDNARTMDRLKITGTFLWALAASDVDAEIDVHFNRQQNNAVTFKEGMVIAGINFDELFITNTAQAGKTITFFAAVERNPNAPGTVRVINPSASLSNVSISNIPTVKKTFADTLTDTGDVSLSAGATTQIVAANADRREVVITNLASNTQTFRIGASTAGAARGIPLAPGESIVLSTSDEVHGHNPGGSAESVAVLEIEDTT